MIGLVSSGASAGMLAVIAVAYAVAGREWAYPAIAAAWAGITFAHEARAWCLRRRSARLAVAVTRSIQWR